MATLPKKNPVSVVDQPFTNPQSLRENQHRDGDQHGRMRVLGSITSDPTNTPADGNIWIWHNKTENKTKLKLGDGTVHVIAPFEAPVVVTGSGSSVTITTGGVNPTNGDLTLEPGTWCVIWTALVTGITPGTNVTITALLEVASGTATITQDSQSFDGDGIVENRRQVTGMALVEVTATAVIRIDASKSLSAGSYTLNSAGCSLLAFVPAGAASATGAGHAAVTVAAGAAAAVLDLSGQEIDLDTQAANVVLAGPSSGGAAKPGFRALVVADIPFDDATSDPVAAGTTAAADGTEGSPARKDHRHAVDQSELIQTASFTIEDPTNSEDFGLYFFYRAVTVVEVQAVVVGSSTPSVTINPKHSTDRSAAGNALLSSATAITNTTTGQNLTSFNDATIPADSWLWLETTAQSGTVAEIQITVRYTVDA